MGIYNVKPINVKYIEVLGQTILQNSQKDKVLKMFLSLLAPLYCCWYCEVGKVTVVCAYLAVLPSVGV